MTLAQHIIGNHVTLRPIEISDTILWSAWDRDITVQQYMPEPRILLSDAQQVAYFNQCLSAPDEIHASIIENSSGTTIGTISLTDIHIHHGTAELGMVMGDTGVWGRGYGSEALSLFLKYIRENTTIVRITAEYESENIAMQKLLTKSGFVTECICKKSRVKNSRRIDTVRDVLQIIC